MWPIRDEATLTGFKKLTKKIDTIFQQILGYFKVI
jgi:hypothetical protein